jgi:hypothetical protein
MNKYSKFLRLDDKESGGGGHGVLAVLRGGRHSGGAGEWGWGLFQIENELFGVHQ